MQQLCTALAAAWPCSPRIMTLGLWHKALFHVDSHGLFSNMMALITSGLWCKGYGIGPVMSNEATFIVNAAWSDRHTHTHTLTLAHKPSHTLTLTSARAHTHTHTHTHSLSHTHTPKKTIEKRLFKC